MCSAGMYVVFPEWTNLKSSSIKSNVLNQQGFRYLLSEVCKLFRTTDMLYINLSTVRTPFHHPHSLIHKACGWMLREISKRDAESVLRFFQRYCDVPSVMRGYALERIRKRKIDEIKSFDDFVYYANIPESF